MSSATHLIRTLRTNLLFIIALLTWSNNTYGQNRELYFLQFDQKDYALAEDQLPIHRESRALRGIQTDSLDYPIRQDYVNILRALDGIRIKFPLRWLNGVVVEVAKRNDSLLFNQCEFVTSQRWLGSQKIKYDSRGIPEKNQTEKPELKLSAARVQAHLNYGLASAQNKAIGIEALHASNHLGQGVKIAVFDAGFLKADRLPAFAHLSDEKSENGQVVMAIDLVDDEKNVWDDDDHGLHVLSCLAGWDPGRMIGTAPFADYYLFRTENARSEYVIEEYYWMRAAEMADSLGIDIINSSLGYNEFDAKEMNYTPQQLDGKHSIIAKAAEIAVKKGMMVVNAAGNEGNKRWKKLITPADAHGVLSVGSVDIHQNTSSFSSMGPTADGRIKPDVVAQGSSTAIASSFGSYYQGNGTSYACPIVCGAMACLKQKYPQLSPSDGLSLIRYSSNHNERPDTLQGWGLPNMEVADFFARQIFKFDKSAAILNVPDTIKGSLNLALYNHQADKAQCKLKRKSKLLGFIPFNKSVLREKIEFSSMHSIYRAIELGKYKDEGMYRLSIKIKEQNGTFIRFEEAFYNRLNF